MPLPVGAVVAVTYRGLCLSQRVLFTMHYRVSATTSTSSVTADLALIGSLFGDPVGGVVIPEYLDCLPSNMQVLSTRTQEIQPDRSVYIDTITDSAGTFDDIAATVNLQHPLTLTTAFSGRDQIGVKKVGPAPSGAVVGGAPTAAYRTLLGDLGEALIATQVEPTNAITLEPVLYHPSDESNNPLFNYRVPDRTGTMRRRTLRVGE